MPSLSSVICGLEAKTSEEYIIEIGWFSSIEKAKAWAKAHIKGKPPETINIVSRDITVIDITEEND